MPRPLLWASLVVPLLEVLIVGQGQGREVLSEKDFAILDLEVNRQRLRLDLASDKWEVKVLVASSSHRL